MSRPSVLDVLYPYAGPCAICGGPDKRHRLADALVGCVEAGDTVDQVADAYDVRPDAVRTLVEHRQRQRRRHKARWAA